MITWHKYPKIKPKHQQLVLCYDAHGNMFFDYFAFGSFGHPYVTHWAEQPDPPNQQEE